MDTISLVSSFLKMIFALAIVLGLLIAVLYFVKRIMQQTSPAKDNQALINIISSKYLGPKSSILLIEVLDQIIVVGVSNQQMSMLACIDDPGALAKLEVVRSKSGTIDFPGSKMAKYISQLGFSAPKRRDKGGK
jgi:flagellar biosynthetic protein FliO